MTVGILAAGFLVSSTWRISTALRRPDPWNTGDWLIDYSAGFVRRGLFGSLVGLVSWSPASSEALIVLVQVSCSLFITAFTIANVVRTPAAASVVAIALSPSFLLFGVMEPEAAFRKEWLGLVSLTALLLAVEPNLSDGRRRLSLVFSSATFVVAVFSHEANILLIPALSWVLLDADLPRRERNFVAFSVTITAFIAGIASVVFRGSSALAEAQCKSLVNRGFEPGICDGAIAWLGRTAGNPLYNGAELYGLRLPLLLPLAIFASAPFALFRWPSAQIIAVVTIGSSIAIPLSLVSLDHGRWLWLAVTVCTLIALPKIRRGEVATLPIPGIAAFCLAFSWAFGHKQIHVAELPVLNKLIKTLSEIVG